MGSHDRRSSEGAGRGQTWVSSLEKGAGIGESSLCFSLWVRLQVLGASSCLCGDGERRAWPLVVLVPEPCQLQAGEPGAITPARGFLYFFKSLGAWDLGSSVCIFFFYWYVFIMTFKIFFKI